MNGLTQANGTMATERESIDPRIPVYLIIGDTGAAKTRLVERVLADTSQKEPIAFVAMDSASWKLATRVSRPVAAAPAIVRLETGQICIDAGVDPVDAVYQLHLRKLGLLAPALDYGALVMDIATGVDAGAFVAVVQNDTRLDVTYRLAGILHAVDARELPERPDERQERHLGFADTVVVTNSSEKEAQAPEIGAETIASVNPFASVLDIQDFDLKKIRDAERGGILGAHGSDRYKRHSTGGAVRFQHKFGSSRVLVSNLYNARNRNAAVDRAPVRGVSMSMPGSVDIMDFMSVIKKLVGTLGSDLLRMAAVLNIRNVDHPVAIDVIGGTLLHPAFHARDGAGRSTICLIARGLDVEETVRSIEDCGADGARLRARLEGAI